ncbi:MAG TPA: Uma2 family endonuclease [Gemmataceae bacterium]|jgi:Uma2 family endonuclease|nr:Uma2 family endonuclease [Gemmataceae bacterium]
MSTKAPATKPRKKQPHPLFPDGHTPTWEVAYLFPAQGAWTEDDYLDLDAIHQGHPRIELSNGRLEVLPMPTQSHQLILAFLFELLKAFTRVHAPGLVLFSGMRLRLKPGQFRDPDIVYMKAEHAHRRQEKYWEGADLAMEIVSGDPKDRQRDLEVKPREYARARISEYWIIDPKRRQISVLTLKGRAYKVHGDFGPGAQATSVLLPGFAVAVDAVWAVARGEQAR